MTREEFFAKYDVEIQQAIQNKKVYYYFMSVKLPCSITEFKNHYRKHGIEIIGCAMCKNKYDIILTLNKP